MSMKAKFLNIFFWIDVPCFVFRVIKRLRIIGLDDKDDNGTTPTSNKDKPIYNLDKDAATLSDFANSKENIARDLAFGKDAGFTDIVVDVRQLAMYYSN